MPSDRRSFRAVLQRRRSSFVIDDDAGKLWISVANISGNVVCDRAAMDPSETIESLKRYVAQSIGEVDKAIKLLYNGQELQATASLADAGIIEATTMTLVVKQFRTDIERLFTALCTRPQAPGQVCFVNDTPRGPHFQPVGDECYYHVVSVFRVPLWPYSEYWSSYCMQAKCPFSEADAASRIEELSKRIDAELPEDLVQWLEVLLQNDSVLHDEDSAIRLDPFADATWKRQTAGLLYLSWEYPDDYHENVYMVDVCGKIAQSLEGGETEGSRGAIWFASLNSRAKRTPSLEFWLELADRQKNGGSEVDGGPPPFKITRVASSFSDFVREWLEVGRAPPYRMWSLEFIATELESGQRGVTSIVQRIRCNDALIRVAVVEALIKLGDLGASEDAATRVFELFETETDNNVWSAALRYVEALGELGDAGAAHCGAIGEMLSAEDAYSDVIAAGIKYFRSQGMDVEVSKGGGLTIHAATMLEQKPKAKSKLESKQGRLGNASATADAEYWIDEAYVEAEYLEEFSVAQHHRQHAMGRHAVTRAEQVSSRDKGAEVKQQQRRAVERTHQRDTKDTIARRVSLNTAQ